LHYDFRLELGGVLKSWAVPKGPSLDPRDKRLAVQVEDHPVEYADFEGIIPKGEYGGGAVIVWDRGTWQPDGNALSDYQAGHLKFHLAGSKLRGGWMLVRMPGRSGERAENWLLIKERDDEARPADEFDVVRDEPNSVVSGRSVEQIADAPERMWSADGHLGEKAKRDVKARRKFPTGGKSAQADSTKPAPAPSRSKPRAKKKD
jgi:bifunctional non-homologous end joining protein LigD